MRRSLLRFGFAGSLAFLLAAAAAWGQMKPVGPLPPPGGAAAKDDKKDRRPGDEALTFWFPYDRDSKQRLQAARDYLSNKDIDWNRVCFALQSILDAKSDSFFDFNETAGAEVRVRRISVKTEANRIIGSFPKEGLQFYQQTYGQTAAALLKEAVDGGYDRAALADVSQRYFHTKAGAEATVLLGTILLDRGTFLEAAYAFERLLGRPESEAFLTPRTLFKAALALHRSGDPRHADAARRVWERLARGVTREGLAVGRRVLSLDDLHKEYDRPVPSFAAAAGLGEWAMRYGNPSHNALAEGGPPFLVPAFRPFPMLHHLDESDPDPFKQELREGAEWVRQHLAAALKKLDQQKQKPPALPAFFPLTAPDMLLFRSYDGVYAIATRDRMTYGRLVPAGELRWFSATQYGVSQMVSGSDRKTTAGEWWQAFMNTRVESLLFENPLLGAMAHDGQNVYFVDDLAIPPPPIVNDPNFGFQQPPPTTFGPLAPAIRSNVLTALNLQNGKLVWTLGGPAAAPLTEEDEDKATSAYQLCQDAFFLGPPLPLNGRLYVLVERNGRMRLLCLDPRTLVAGAGADAGRRRWSGASGWASRTTGCPTTRSAASRARSWRPPRASSCARRTRGR